MERIDLVTGDVVPSTLGPHVEQIGWGVARQVARRWAVGDRDADTGPVPEPLTALLEEAAELAERPGHAAYACFEGREVVAVALLRLDSDGATHLGEARRGHASPDVSAAFVVRMLHDAAHAGAARLTVLDPAVDLTPFGPVIGR